jgi:cytochrome P450
VSFLLDLPSTPLPGPRRTPLLGARGNLVRFFQDPVRGLLRLYREFGSVAALTRDDPSLVFVFDAELNRKVLSAPDAFHNFVEYPFPIPPGSMTARYNANLVGMNGEMHKKHRRMIMPAFGKAQIERYRDDMVEVAERALGAFRPGERVDMSSSMVEVTMCIAVKGLFGLNVQHEIDQLGQLTMGMLKLMAHPATTLLPLRIPGMPYRRMLDASEAVIRRVQGLVDERRRQAGEGHDVLSILIRAHDEDDSVFSDVELVSHAIMFFIAGHETTAQTLTWTLFLLSQHPRVQAAVIEEARSTLGGRAPSSSDLERLPLLDRVVKESMRIITANPYIFMRRSTQPFDLGGRSLPAGATMVVSPLVTHRLHHLYPEPDRFLPERWERIKPSLYEYLPFGAGPRMCVGAGFASQAIRIVLALLLQRFRPRVVDGSDISRQMSTFFLGAKHGMPMQLDPIDGPIPPAPRVRGDIHELVALPS